MPYYREAAQDCSLAFRIFVSVPVLEESSKNRDFSRFRDETDQLVVPSLHL